jgi:hypothetical protein
MTGSEPKQLREDLGGAIGHRLSTADMAKICGLKDPERNGKDTWRKWEDGAGPSGPVASLMSILVYASERYRPLQSWLSRVSLSRWTMAGSSRSVANWSSRLTQLDSFGAERRQLVKIRVRRFALHTCASGGWRCQSCTSRLSEGPIRDGVVRSRPVEARGQRCRCNRPPPVKHRVSVS